MSENTFGGVLFVLGIVFVVVTVLALGAKYDNKKAACVESGGQWAEAVQKMHSICLPKDK